MDKAEIGIRTSAIFQSKLISGLPHSLSSKQGVTCVNFPPPLSILPDLTSLGGSGIIIPEETVGAWILSYEDGPQLYH